MEILVPGLIKLEIALYSAVFLGEKKKGKKKKSRGFRIKWSNGLDYLLSFFPFPFSPLPCLSNC